MSPDLLVMAVLAAGAVAGALGGALRQVVHLAAVAAAALLGPRLAPLLQGPVSRVAPGSAAAPAATLAGLALVFVAASLGGHLLLRLLAGEAQRSPADRAAGALVGGLQAGLGAWALLSVLVLWGRPVGGGAWRLDPRQGQAAALAREHNLLDLAAPEQAAALRQALPRLREQLDALEQQRPR